MGDIAKRAGVSQMTVSRVMGRNGYVSEDVVRRVEAAAKEIGYVQNRLAHGLRSDNTQLIAVAIPSLSNTVFTEILHAIIDCVTKNGFRPVFGITDYNQDQENELVRDLLAWRPYGMVLFGLEHTDDTRNMIKSSGIRVAEIMDIDGSPISAAFGLSHIKAGQVTAEFMLSKGHRRFAYIGSFGGNDLRAVKRFNGFMQTIEKAGATLISKEISNFSSSINEGSRMTAEIMSRPEKPDAIYYANDDLAAGGMLYCISNNIKIPDELALAGFNGLPFLESFPMQLTTIRTPRYDIGFRAGNFLISADSDPLGQQSIDLGFEFIEGQTC
jgi:LacI family gluconate utilization system Gnt-I transcriptional repressor